MSADETGEQEMRMLREEDEKLAMENELMNEKMAIEMRAEQIAKERAEKMAQERMRAEIIIKMMEENK
jgi:hypothetical protein